MMSRSGRRSLLVSAVCRSACRSGQKWRIGRSSALAVAERLTVLKSQLLGGQLLRKRLRDLVRVYRSFALARLAGLGYFSRVSERANFYGLRRRVCLTTIHDQPQWYGEGVIAGGNKGGNLCRHRILLHQLVGAAEKLNHAVDPL